MDFQLVQNKYYEIRPVKDLAKIVQVGWGADTPGDTFEVYPPGRYDANWHKFLIYPLDDSHYAIVCKNSGKVMKVSRDDNNNGRWIEQWDWLPDAFGQARESVYFQSVTSDTHALKYKGTGKYMTLSNRSVNDGNVCEQWEWQNGDWQYWKLVPLSEGITLPSVPTAPPPVAPNYDPAGGLDQSLPEKSETVVTEYALLPFFMVNDPHFSDVLKKFQSNPYYLLLKRQFYAKVFKEILIPGQTITYSVATGIRETEQREFEVTVSMTVGMDYGLNFKKFSTSLQWEISKQIRTLVSTSTEESKEINISRTMTNTAAHTISFTVYQLVTEYQALRSDGTSVGGPWRVKSANDTVTRVYPIA
jgi:hypothetical protein